MWCLAALPAEQQPDNVPLPAQPPTGAAQHLLRQPGGLVEAKKYASANQLHQFRFRKAKFILLKNKNKKRLCFPSLYAFHLLHFLAPARDRTPRAPPRPLTAAALRAMVPGLTLCSLMATTVAGGEAGGWAGASGSATDGDGAAAATAPASAAAAALVCAKPLARQDAARASAHARGRRPPYSRRVGSGAGGGRAGARRRWGPGFETRAWMDGSSTAAAGLPHNGAGNLLKSTRVSASPLFPYLQSSVCPKEPTGCKQALRQAWGLGLPSLHSPTCTHGQPWMRGNTGGERCQDVSLRPLSTASRSPTATLPGKGQALVAI